MKEYTSLGQLLTDYKEFSNTSRLDLASQFSVDVRTIIRWEKNETLLKADKEEEMVDITFIPYQVIRNLNAPVAIPTFYDFSLRKYSTSEFSKNIPDLSWIKSINDLTTERLRKINHKSDIADIRRCSMIQSSVSKPISDELILKATELLPEANFVLHDTSGFYCGHSVYFPLKQETYEKIKAKEITESEITINDLVDYKTVDKPVFYAYDLSADCNENLFYVTTALRNFFKTINKFITASYTSREDTCHINEQLGNTLIWEEETTQNGNKGYCKAL